MELREIETKKIKRNENNPRGIDIAKEDKKLAMLIDSIANYGIMVPLILSDKGDYYLLIDGERRFEAAKALGLKEVPAYVFGNVSSNEILLRMFHIHHNMEQWGPIQQCAALEILYGKITQTSIYQDLESEEEKVELCAKYIEQQTGVEPRTARGRVLFLRWPIDIKKKLYKNPSDSHTYIIEIENGIILPVAKNYPEFLPEESFDPVRRSLFKKLAVNAVSKGISVRAASPIFTFETHEKSERAKIYKIFNDLVSDGRMTYQEAREEFELKFPNAMQIAPPSPRKLFNALCSTCEKIDLFDSSSISRSKGRSKATKSEILDAIKKLRESLTDLETRIG